eukprot:4924238-Pleurochrysis_carterae.AAC.2
MHDLLYLLFANLGSVSQCVMQQKVNLLQWPKIVVWCVCLSASGIIGSWRRPSILDRLARVQLIYHCNNIMYSE